MLNITYQTRDGSYSREVQVFAAPHIGDEVMIDHVCGRVTNVIWHITRQPNGRAVTVIIG